MKRTNSILVALALSALAPACYLSRNAVNRPLDPASIGAFEPGVTTARDVVEILGAPSRIVQLGNRSAYEYEHTQGKTTGVFLLLFATVHQDTRADRAWLFFDEDDVLTHLGTTLEADGATWGMPWSDPYE